MLLIIASIIVPIIITLSAMKWQRAISVVFILLVIEGALRKWFFPGASDLIYFLKDLVLVGIYLRFFLTKSRVFFKLSFNNILLFFISGWCLLQVFNPALGSPIVGIFGLRGYLFYIPIMWILPTVIVTETKLYKFVRSHLLLTIPVGLLGIAQFFSPPTSPLNVYAPGDLSEVATFNVAANFVRVTGTFSYLSGFSTYLLVCFGLLIPLLLLKQSRLWQVLTLIELLLVVVNSFMTGSRSVLIFEILFLVFYLGIKLFLQAGSTLRLLQKIIPALVVVMLVTLIWFQPAVDVFWQRTTTNQDIPTRVTGRFVEPFDFMHYKALDGFGTGATHQAAPSLRQALNLPAGEAIPVYYEDELGRIALELGPFGFIAWYGFRLSLLGALWLTFLKLKRPLLKELALAAFLIQGIQITGQLVTHHTFLVYYWFLSSFIYLLPQLERLENQQRSSSYWVAYDQPQTLTHPPHQ